MNERAAFLRIAADVSGRSAGALAGEPAPYVFEDVFALIEKTAETVRELRENADRFAAWEEAALDQIERDRAVWRNDLDELRRTVEACLKRSIEAERETGEAREMARAALELRDEARAKEAAASKRADVAEAGLRAAEEKYLRLENFLSTSFSEIAQRRLRR